MTELDGHVHVKISGSAVYNAVKNFILHNTGFQNLIKDEVAKMVAAGMLAQVMERNVKEQMSSSFLKGEMQKAVKAVLTEEVRAMIKSDIQANVKEALSNVVVVVPKW
jgi:hypothetical protein